MGSTIKMSYVLAQRKNKLNPAFPCRKKDISTALGPVAKDMNVRNSKIFAIPKCNQWF
jgi:hypothetical protein